MKENTIIRGAQKPKAVFGSKIDCPSSSATFHKTGDTWGWALKEAGVSYYKVFYTKKR